MPQVASSLGAIAAAEEEEAPLPQTQTEAEVFNLTAGAGNRAAEGDTHDVEMGAGRGGEDNWVKELLM